MSTETFCGLGDLGLKCGDERPIALFASDADGCWVLERHCFYMQCDGLGSRNIMHWLTWCVAYTLIFRRDRVSAEPDTIFGRLLLSTEVEEDIVARCL